MKLLLSIKYWLSKRTFLEWLFMAVILWQGYKEVVNDLQIRSNEKFLKTEVEKDKATIDSLTIQLSDLQKKGQVINRSSRKKSKSITDKLKKDEEIIDMRIVTDAMRKRYLSKHGEYND